MKIRLFYPILIAGVLTATPCFAQIQTLGANIDGPRLSQGASVSQTIGVTDISISYHRPGVKDREIWGTRLVPYGGKPYPWRAGANENTRITFSTDVTINGEPLPAGAYGFHIIPTEDEWTLVFSNASNAWGSFSYNPDQDALRINVTPTECDHREWLVYGFDDIGDDYAVAYMEWEKKRIEFTIKVDLAETVLSSFREQLTNVGGFTWTANYQAANWCLENEINTEEALQWADNSIRWNKNDFNLTLKAKLLKSLGRDTEAKATMLEAIEAAPDERKEDARNAYQDLFGEAAV